MGSGRVKIMQHGTIIKVAEGNFPFHFWIQKASAVDDGDRMVVEGVASTINVDHDKERMSAEALKSMARIINTSGVPLRVEHSQNDNAIIGNVNKAWIDERNQLWIKAVLDEKHPAAGILYNGLKEGVKMGLSVGGYVKRAVQEMVEGVGKEVNTFYDVLLDEVSVTQKPSNYDARLMAKSFAKSEGQVDALAGAFESSEFLFNSAVGATDYLHAFAKSVEGEWKDYKLASKDNSMEDTDEKKTKAADDTDEKKTTKAEDTDEKKTTKAEDKGKDDDKTEKSVSRQEFNNLVKMVGELGNSITSAIGKMAKAMDMGSTPKDQHQPDEKKEDPEEGKEVSKISGGEALDGEQPDEKKVDPEAGKNVDKSADGAGEGDGDDLHGEREKTRKAGKDKEDTYDLETVERSIKRIKAVTKAFGESDDKDEKKTKTSDKEDEKVTKSTKVASIDALAIAVADYIEGAEKKMSEGGFQTQHIAKSMINELRSNPQFRKDVEHFMAEPGKKRSVVNGTPFVKMKNGRMFALTLSDVKSERTEKSAGEDAPKTFKGIWGTRFSSQKESE